MRAQIVACDLNELGVENDLQEITTHLHGLHESLLKKSGPLRTSLPDTLHSKAQMRIQDLL